MDTLNSAVVLLNHWGVTFCGLAERMLIQSSILIGLLLAADILLRARVSACFRYAMWLLVLIKLVLPPSLALPIGIAYWLGGHLPATPPARAPAPAISLPTSVGPLHDVVATSSSVMAMTPAGHGIASVQWPGLVLLAWAAGILLLSALILRRVVSVRRTLRRSLPAPRQMIVLLEECQARLGGPLRTTLRLTADMHSPCVCGVIRPVILLPASLPAGLEQAQLRTILTHELAHIKRLDPWTSLAQAVMQIVYFWHPLVWVANARLRYLRELAVDETVVVTLRCQVQCYTDTLIDIAQMAFRKPAFSLRLIGIAESRRALERRITHMLNGRIVKRPSLGLFGLLTILAMGALLVPMGRASVAAPAKLNAVQSAPALPQGVAELLQLAKDDILKKFGQPERISFEDKTYTLENLPAAYCLAFKDISFNMHEGTVAEVTLRSPSYIFGNGVHVGDSQDKVQQAFGPGAIMEGPESEDLLGYEGLGVGFLVNRPDHLVKEIIISREYGDPALQQAYAHAEEFAAALPGKLARFDIDSADLKKALATFGAPVKYVWGSDTLPPDKLPNRFVAEYPGGFNIFMMDGRIVELRHEAGSKYAYAGKLRCGSTVDEAVAVLGAPVKTVEGKPINWQDSANVLFKDIDGKKGHCYYHRPDQKVRVWFGNYKVAAIYMTRSDYSDGGISSPSDPEFARLLAQRVAALNIDSANLEQVKAIFGEPIKYVWGNQAFTADALPNQYVMTYPCGFNVYMSAGRIVEIRHEQGSPYVYRGVLRLGSTLQEALDLLGQPQDVVTGQKNTFKEKVLYKDIDGREGHDYYHRPDQHVRVWFAGDKVAAIYMTRSDFPAAN